MVNSVKCESPEGRAPFSGTGLRNEAECVPLEFARLI